MTTIEGQPSLFIQDLKGKEYPAIAEVKRNKRVNGQRELTLSFLYTDINKDFIYDLEFGWEVRFDGEWYTITHPGYSTDGDYIAIDVTAVLSFFVVMNGYYLQDSVEDKSFTAANYFRDLFEGTPYTYVLVDHLPANTLSYQDNQSKTERFLYGIDRFKGEYKINDRVAYIYEQVGSDKDVILHEDLNVNSVKIDVDASGFHTYAKGYGDLPEGEEDADYQLEVDYLSPLIEKYGKIEGPAIKDGRYKDKDELKEAVKEQVENSYKISTEVDAADLTNNGYPEMILEEGDRVWLAVDKLNLNQQVRVMEVNETFDWEGNVISANYTLGNEGIAIRYKTEQYNTIADFRDIQSGRKKLEYNWLPDAIRRASEIINGNEDSLFKYGAGEIIGINQNNPNGYMRFNTDGLGFSRDGGKTYRSAITYEGIVADAITTGTLRGIVIEGVDIFGAYLQSLNSDNTFWDLNTGLLRLQNTDFELGGGANIHFTDSGNKLYYQRKDPQGSRDTAAGVGFGININERYGYTYLGVSDGNYPYANDGSNFAGFIANSRYRPDEDNIGNSSVGDMFQVRDKPVSFTQGWTFDLRGTNKEFYPMYTGDYDYDLGNSNNHWNRLFLKSSIHSNRGRTDIEHTFAPSQGFSFLTSYQDDDSDGNSHLVFRGKNSNDYYNLGAPGGWRWSYIYLNYQPDVASDARLKENIHHNVLGLDFIRDLETKTFNLINHNPRIEKEPTQFGVLAQQLRDTLIKHGVDIENINMLSQSDDGMYGVQYNQLIVPIIKAIQEIIERLEVLENGTATA